MIFINIKILVNKTRYKDFDISIFFIFIDLCRYIIVLISNL